MDGGISGVITNILTDVVGWPKERIHIGKIPDKWHMKWKKVYDAVTKDAEALDAILGTNPLLAGVLPGSTNGANTISDPANVTDAALEALIFDPADVEIAMATIRQLESNNNYTIHSSSSTASGAYQYVNGTWGNYQGFPNAASAPPEVQDARARADILGIYQKHGNKLMNIPRIWYYGESIMNRPEELDPVPGGGGNTMTIRGYSYKWGRIYVTKYNEAHGTTATSNSSNATTNNSTTTTNTPYIPGNDTPVNNTSTTNTAAGILYPIPAGIDELDVDEVGWGGYQNGHVPAAAMSSGAHSGKGHPKAIEAYEKMWIEANKAGFDISGFFYRSAEDQATVGSMGVPVGRSNHGWGLAIDISALADGSGGSWDGGMYQWLGANAYKWGMGHPQWAQRGGSKPEIWHWEFFHIYTMLGQGGTAVQGVNPFTSTSGDVMNGANIQAQIFAALQLWEGNWTEERDPMSDLLFGYKALLNDEPVLMTLDSLVTITGRKYCSAPNGDFIAWWPDYWGEYGLSGSLELKTIEMLDFTVRWSDAGLVTHQYVEGAVNPNGQGPLPGGVRNYLSSIKTQGLATVTMPGLLEALINVPSDQAGLSFLSSGSLLLKRFGARVSRITDTRIFGPHQEFWFAISKFTEAWATMFHARVPMTFMPELFPGMLLKIPEFKVQFYVAGVTHRWNLGTSEGFSTEAIVMAPSATDGSGFYLLPKGGHVFA